MKGSEKDSRIETDQEREDMYDPNHQKMNSIRFTEKVITENRGVAVEISFISILEAEI